MDSDASQHDPPPRPESDYHWIHDSAGGFASTFTFIAGTDLASALAAFGADAQPTAPSYEGGAWEPRVSGLALATGVVLWENIGFHGSTGPAIAAVSRDALAASMYWDANALTLLSFARDGVVLDQFEPLLQPPTTDDPDVLAALADLDLEDLERDLRAQGLLAADRFTGVRLAPADMEALADDDRSHLLPRGVT